ncbi:MAG: hypothetical protein E6Q40_11700 [Cupriavidus sp.]|nr:MAG: hypothetical protein E6Q40_11700 [Cupriavidus sp.]
MNKRMQLAAFAALSLSMAPAGAAEPVTAIKALAEMGLGGAVDRVGNPQRQSIQNWAECRARVVQSIVMPYDMTIDGALQFGRDMGLDPESLFGRGASQPHYRGEVFRAAEGVLSTITSQAGPPLYACLEEAVRGRGSANCSSQIGPLKNAMLASLLSMKDVTSVIGSRIGTLCRDLAR